MKCRTVTPNVEVLRENFSYDATTGRLVWSKPRRKIVVGEEAGSVSVWGYRVVCFDYKRYFVHRLIWKMEMGYDAPKFIDHVDGDPLNNRLSNLRLATNSQNNWNSKTPKKNTSGVKGVHWDADRKAWFAQISRHGKRVALGRYQTLEEAKQVRVRAAESAHGEFARHA